DVGGIDGGNAGVEIECGGFAEESEDRAHVFDGAGLVERNPDRVGVDVAKVVFLRVSGGVHAGGGDVRDGERVEHGLRVHFRAEADEALGEERREEFRAAGDAAEAFGPVVN